MIGQTTVRENIQRHLPELSDAERLLADYTLAAYRRCAMLGISELAENCGVSTATVNRYARALGYKGYHAYRAALVGEASSLDSVELFHESLRGSRADDVKRMSIGVDQRGLERLMSMIDDATFERVVSAIRSARRVFVFGQGSSTYLAGYFVFNLQGLGIDAQELATPSGVEGIARSMLMIGADDLLIPIAFPRFSNLTLEMAETARATGCRIQSLTSTVVGPLAEASDEVLLAPPRVELHSGSAVTAMSMIEALLSELTHLHEPAMNAAARLSPMIDGHVR